MVTVPPTGIDPFQAMPVEVTVTVPELAVWSPLLTASGNTALRSAEIVIPV